MTKEIKFRAINKISGKVFEVCGMSNMIKNDNENEPEWLHCLNIKQIAIREICNTETYEKPNWINVEDYHLLQYTGLKDKNGKEIFESDVLKIYYENNQRSYLKKVEWLNDAINKGRWDALDNCVFTSCEVIGNIYENPELLEAKND